MLNCSLMFYIFRNNPLSSSFDMTTPIQPPACATLSSTRSNQDILPCLQLELPDPNRLTSTPQYTETVASRSVFNTFSPDILNATEFFIVIEDDGNQYLDLEDDGNQYLDLGPKQNVNLESAQPVIVKDSSMDAVFEFASVDNGDDIIDTSSVGVICVPPCVESACHVSNVVELPEKTAKKKINEHNRKKQAPTNPYGYFLLEEKARLAIKSESLDITEALSKWKSLNSLEKAKYQKMYRDEKDKLGNLYRKSIKKNKMKPEEVHEKKLAKDRLRQQKIRSKTAMKIYQEKNNIEKLETMIQRKTEKITSLKTMKERLKSELFSSELETQAVVKLINEKENAEKVMKEKYKLVFKHHSVCKRE